jgi:DNA (cytosine-5)-methyltransferase 1
MSHVDLCSGIGGFALGFEWAGLSKPVLFCDIEPWSRKVLAKHWPHVPIAHDVKELANDPARLVPDCDILTAGYPCQPFSVAGKQRGAEDDRHIWPEIFKIIQAKRPTWIVCENVSGHISLGLNQVLSDLEDKAGYAVQTFCVGAVSVNAPHRRQRIWIIAHTNSHGEPDGTKHEQRMERATVVGDTSSKGFREPHNNKGVSNWVQHEFSQPSDALATHHVADTDNEGSQGRLSGRQGAAWQGEHGHARCSGTAHRQSAKDWWAVEPSMGRVAHGIPGRVDRLKGLGNAIVPQIAMQIGLTIKAVRDA